MKRARIRRQSAKARRRQASWPDIRRQVHDRALGVCEARTVRCDRFGTQAHHIRRRSQGGTDTPANLLWVCGPCHAHIHDNPAEAYEQGWMTR